MKPGQRKYFNKIKPGQNCLHRVKPGQKHSTESRVKNILKIKPGQKCLNAVKAGQNSYKDKNGSKKVSVG